MHLTLFGFGMMEQKLFGQGFLMMTGYAQSLAMLSMAVTLLDVAEPEYRGLVMGVRMLAVYGLPLGLLLAGGVGERLGFPVTVTLYSIIGLTASAWIAYHWREAIWYYSKDG